MAGSPTDAIMRIGPSEGFDALAAAVRDGRRIERRGRRPGTAARVRGAAVAALLVAACAHAPPVAPVDDGALALTAIPARVFKETFGDGPGAQDRFVFFAVLADARGRAPEPRRETLELYAHGALVETRVVDGAALSSLRTLTFRPDPAAPGAQLVRHFVHLDEAFDVRVGVQVPAALAVDRAVVRLDVALPAGRTVEKRLDVPILAYAAPRVSLSFPVAGDFLVICGHVGEDCHDERSQHFALDVLPVGKRGELLAGGDGSRDEDYYGWGREIHAPADGVVVHARNDVPDQTTPQRPDPSTFVRLDEPAWAAVGNSVVIDHGGGEYSVLAHMQCGSVRVRGGDHVKRGQVVGLLGASGNVTGPHLHYQLMAGPEIFRADPLPSRFDDIAPAVPRAGHFAGAK